MCLHNLCFINTNVFMTLKTLYRFFQLTTGTTLDAGADDLPWNALRGDAADSQLPASTPFPKGANVLMVKDQGGDVTVGSNRDSLPIALVSTGADNLRVNDPRGVATASGKKNLRRPTILVSPGTEGPLANVPSGRDATEECMFHQVACVNISAQVVMAGEVTKVTGLANCHNDYDRDGHHGYGHIFIISIKTIIMFETTTCYVDLCVFTFDTTRVDEILCL